jgi:predicted RNA-binding protein YlxR (DUF448 family)
MSMSTPARKHVPERTCVVCREKASKRTLTRVVRSEIGVQVDPSGKMNGRGAYLCDRVVCWETAVKTDVLAKALRMPLTDDDRERLRRARA